MTTTTLGAGSQACVQRKWFGDWGNDLAGRDIEAGRIRPATPPETLPASLKACKTFEEGGAVSNVVLDPDEREPQVFFRHRRRHHRLRP